MQLTSWAVLGLIRPGAPAGVSCRALHDTKAARVGAVVLVRRPAVPPVEQVGDRRVAQRELIDQLVVSSERSRAVVSGEAFVDHVEAVFDQRAQPRRANAAPARTSHRGARLAFVTSRLRDPEPCSRGPEGRRSARRGR